ncbi:MAG: glycosyltransferase [Planctomycetes bacterium]|nr:glycosyltransferase [Planctomycetota bacterium]MCB9891138.1 glycosyltransferase [Planctomycetota bacterium]MCB9918905.1 glycosyltransferase [Planctomycetota bacterium]
MKIAHVISDYLPASRGGTQLHLSDLSRALGRLGHDCVIFAGERGTGRKDFSVADDVHDGVPVRRVTYGFGDFVRFDRLYVHPKIDARFGDWLDEVRPDIVHVHHFSALSTRFVDVVKGRGLPIVLTLHDHWLVCPRGQRIHPDSLEICTDLDRSRCLPCLSKLWPHLLPIGNADSRPLSAAHLARWGTEIRRVLATCDLLISPSDFHRGTFASLGMPPHRHVTIEHGLDRSLLSAPPRSRAVRRIGFVGTVLPSKGVHVLAEAMRILARDELELVVHGEVANFHGDTSYGDRLREALGSVRCTFAGAYDHEDLPTILADLDVLVVPSIWWESFCLTIREGALAGLPVVASDHGAMSEAVAQGYALGFRPGDAQELAHALGRVTDEPELRASLVAHASRIRSIDACARETLEHYLRLHREVRT